MVGGSDCHRWAPLVQARCHCCWLGRLQPPPSTSMQEYTQQFVKEAQAKAKAESKLKRRKPKVSTAKRRSVNFQVTKNRRGK